MVQSDVAYAARHRDVMERIATAVVNRLRPDSKIGKVYDYDLTTRKAQIMFAGADLDSLVTVSFAPNNAPSKRMIDNYDTLGNDAPADVVRVSGSPGRYYIDQFLSGEPQNYRYEASVIPIGGIIDWPSDAPPKFDLDYYALDRYLPCDGAMLNITDYPDLFAAIGTSNGGDGINTFRLPNRYGLWEDLDLVLADKPMTAQAGWSVTDQQLYRRGNVVQIYLAATRTGADISVNATNADITNSPLAQINDDNNCPIVQATLTSGSVGRGLFGYVTTDGLIGVSAAAGTGDLSGTSMSFGGTYIVLPPGNAIKMIRAI